MYISRPDQGSQVVESLQGSHRGIEGEWCESCEMQGNPWVTQLAASADEHRSSAVQQCTHEICVT